MAYYKLLYIFLNVLVMTCFQSITGETLRDLLDRISAAQVHTDSSFHMFPFKWEMQKGMYHNEVKLNFHGNEQYFLIRNKFAVPDNNMFAPAWITSCLIEAHVYGKTPRPSTDQIIMSLNAIDKFRNKNLPYRNSEMTFWQQKFNATAKFYQSAPDNLFGILTMPDYLPDKLIEEILEILGLKDLEDAFKRLLMYKDTFALAFHIPPDFDDTFVNIGLGGLLSMFKTSYPDEHVIWMKQNDNLTSVFDSVKKYAYRPFSKTSNQTTIDPRTYMYLRSFLEMAAAKNQDVALVTTWLQDIEEVRTLFSKGVAMPFNVNNVDVTVSANFVYGIIMCACTGVCDQPETLLDTDLQQIFMNTTALIAHEMLNNLSSRPDLALTYYPSKHEFYWFVSRSYAYLNRFFMNNKHPAVNNNINDMLIYALRTLSPVLHSQMTDDIIRSVQKDPSGSLFIDNFLGDNDTNFFNKTVVRAEDRIFTTAVSVNALINTWTMWHNDTLFWQDGTPDYVRGIIKGLVQWLNLNVLSGHYRPWNTFFSGSGKGAKSMPFFYPANRREYFNGTTFSDKTFPTDFRNIIGMRGVVSPAEYDAMLKEPHFGKFTPMTFDGYNSEDGEFFPFWSCDAYTYAVSLLALSQFENILQ